MANASLALLSSMSVSRIATSSGCLAWRGSHYLKPKLIWSKFHPPRSTRLLTTAKSTTNASRTTKTKWPPSLRAFVLGTPIITRPLPKFGRVSIDFGTSMLNFGAITSLSGFMMTDVLWLRSLSIVGSVCGITYNVTRIPRQMNAVAWGFVFVTVNVVQIIRLVLERREIKFSVEEGALYYRSFQPFGVDPRLFRKLMEHAQWKTYPAGKVIIKDGKPLNEVFILVEGTASCYAGSSGNFMYTYTAEENGHVVGATGLVDPEILGRNYPNRVVADKPVRALVMDTRRLRTFMKENDKAVEAALMHMMFVDLIGSLRRQRKEGKEPSAGLGMALHDLKLMLQQACADGIIHPAERRLIREFVEKNGISKEQFNALLQSKKVDWTEKEWEDGAKHSNPVFEKAEKDPVKKEE